MKKENRLIVFIVLGLLLTITSCTDMMDTASKSDKNFPETIIVNEKNHISMHKNDMDTYYKFTVPSSGTYSINFSNFKGANKDKSIHYRICKKSDFTYPIGYGFDIYTDYSEEIMLLYGKTYYLEISNFRHAIEADITISFKEGRIDENDLEETSTIETGTKRNPQKISIYKKNSMFLKKNVSGDNTRYFKFDIDTHGEYSILLTDILGITSPLGLGFKIYSYESFGEYTKIFSSSIKNRYLEDEVFEGPKTYYLEIQNWSSNDVTCKFAIY